MDTFVIRRARREDLDAVGALWADLVFYHHAIDAALPHAAPNGGARYAARVGSHLDDPMACVLVAQQGTYIIGYVLGVIVDLMPEMFEQERSGFLADIFVHAEHRRRGAGRALLAGLTAWFREQGIAHYDWHVAANNPEAVAFWQAMGGRALMLRMRAVLDAPPDDTPGT